MVASIIAKGSDMEKSEHMHTDSFLSERTYRFQVIWMTKNRSNPLGAKFNDRNFKRLSGKFLQA